MKVSELWEIIVHPDSHTVETLLQRLEYLSRIAICKSFENNDHAINYLEGMILHHPNRSK